MMAFSFLSTTAIVLYLTLLLAALSAPVQITFDIAQIPTSWKSGFVIEFRLEEHGSSSYQDSVTVWSHVYKSHELHSGTFTVERCSAKLYLIVEISKSHGSLFHCHRENVLATSRILTSRLLKPDTFYFETPGHAIVQSNHHVPTQISMRPDSYSASDARPDQNRLLMITRGTRGDVQPFVASAAALANVYGYQVTICTESTFQTFIESHSDVQRGSIEFVPSGGNTAARIKGTAATIAIDSNSAAVQALIMSRVESEFFDAEPAMFATAQRLRPRAVIYGFTVTSLATVISEALKIPIVGFILQPTVLPSQHHSPVIPIPEYHDKECSQELIASLRVMSKGIARIRRRRQLPAVNALHDPWYYLMEQKSPMVVPIPDIAFGGRPKDWPSEIVMTQFIYLNDENPTQLSDELDAFLKKGGRILAIAFSSMPVSRSAMNDIVLAIATKSSHKPRIVLIGKPSSNDSSSNSVESQLEYLRKSNRLIEVSNVPFNVLFRRVSAAVIHGGLGTTSEAMRAGLPVIVTGTLLMDQRFWGKRIFVLGMGPEMVSLDKFLTSAPTIVDRLLSKFHLHKAKADELSQKLLDLPEKNPVEALHEAIESAPVIKFVKVKSHKVDVLEAATFVNRLIYGLATSAIKHASRSLTETASFK